MWIRRGWPRVLNSSDLKRCSGSATRSSIPKLWHLAISESIKTGTVFRALDPLHPAFTIGRPFGIAIIDQDHELPRPMWRWVRAVVAVDAHARHDGGVRESKPPLVAEPLVEPDRLAGLESGCPQFVWPAVRRLGAHVAALGILHDHLGDRVPRIVVPGPERAGESDEQRIVLPRERDDVHGLRAAHEPVDGGLRRRFARREAVVVVVVVRVQALLDRCDRDGVEARITTLVVRLGRREDLL